METPLLKVYSFQDLFTHFNKKTLKIIVLGSKDIYSDLFSYEMINYYILPNLKTRMGEFNYLDLDLSFNIPEDHLKIPSNYTLVVNTNNSLILYPSDLVKSILELEVENIIFLVNYLERNEWINPIKKYAERLGYSLEKYTIKRFNIDEILSFLKNILRDYHYDKNISAILNFIAKRRLFIASSPQIMSRIIELFKRAIYGTWTICSYYRDFYVKIKNEYMSKIYFPLRVALIEVKKGIPYYRRGHRRGEFILALITALGLFSKCKFKEKFISSLNSIIKFMKEAEFTTPRLYEEIKYLYTRAFRGLDAFIESLYTCQSSLVILRNFLRISRTRSIIERILSKIRRYEEEFIFGRR